MSESRYPSRYDVLKDFEAGCSLKLMPPFIMVVPEQPELACEVWITYSVVLFTS